ncbi:MAG: hypothetical protein CME71_07305 [Halobacteriovorax sp.]|nr:hypothetical protein [Halobacteriovorax sp.]
MTTASCHQCHKDTGLEAGSAVFRTTECPHCYADMRCCLMCRFHDSSIYNECRETQADRVADKNKSNFCGFFEFSANGANADIANNQLSAAQALFKK